METQPHITVTDVRKLLETVVDPEIPVLTIHDLGILRNVKKEEGKFIITITPTYSGCPATDYISANIRLRLMEYGISHFAIKTQLSPAWTTEWISKEGRYKLREYGIAPPQGKNGNEDLENTHPLCPQCHSKNTVLVSRFGSTACKALFRCVNCSEPFDYFKCH